MNENDIPDVICSKCGGVVNADRRTCTCWERDIDLTKAVVDGFEEDPNPYATAEHIAQMSEREMVSILIELWMRLRRARRRDE